MADYLRHSVFCQWMEEGRVPCMHHMLLMSIIRSLALGSSPPLPPQKKKTEGVVGGWAFGKVKKMHEEAEWRQAKYAKGLRRLYKAQNSKGKRHNTILSTTKIPPTSLTLIWKDTKKWSKKHEKQLLGWTTNKKNTKKQKLKIQKKKKDSGETLAETCPLSDVSGSARGCLDDVSVLYPQCVRDDTAMFGWCSIGDVSKSVLWWCLRVALVMSRWRLRLSDVSVGGVWVTLRWCIGDALVMSWSSVRVFFLFFGCLVFFVFFNDFFAFSCFCCCYFKVFLFCFVCFLFFWNFWLRTLLRGSFLFKITFREAFASVQ